MIGKVKIIAEVKTQSPFGFQSSRSWAELFKVAERVGDIISIHTDPRWGGSFELIRKAKGMTTKPILAKGIHPKDQDIEEAFENGADYVLVVGRIPARSTWNILIEPNSIKDLKKIRQDCMAVWNSRELTNGQRKIEMFAEARKVFNGWLCQASFIRTIDDIDQTADAALIGEHLEEFASSSGLVL